MSEYQKIEELILQIPRFTSKSLPEDTAAFYQFLGEPGAASEIFHIAGTNGKGSTCAYLDGILREAGYSVGLFTSPHLVSMRERIRVNGKMIQEEEFINAYQSVMEKVRKFQEEGSLYNPTFFELLFFMAMITFEKQHITHIVLETGLGGRLDATNVIRHPAVTVITEVGMDHMQYLGDTVEKIAFEKAGIIKESIPVVFWDKRPEVTEIITKKAEECHCPIFCVGNERITDRKLSNKGIDFSYKSRYYISDVNVSIETCAWYQAENASLAIAAIEAFHDKRISVKQISTALSQVKWEGRMEEIAPHIFIDGAHNIDGIDAFLSSISKMGGKEHILLFSAVSDKDYKDMIIMLTEANLFSEIYVTQLSGQRAAVAGDLKNIFTEHTKANVEEIDSVENAFMKCRERLLEPSHIEKESNLYIVGSLYLVGYIKELDSRNQEVCND